MFRLLKLKPPHGWSAVAWELAIITLGVRIALAAQQLATLFISATKSPNWSAAAQRTGRLRCDGGTSAPPTFAACSGSMHSRSGRGRASRRPRSTVPIGCSFRNQHTGAWDLAKTSATTANIPLRQRLIFASLYDAINNWRQMINEEGENARALRGSRRRRINRRTAADRLSHLLGPGFRLPEGVQLRVHVQAVRRAEDRARREPADGSGQRQSAARTAGPDKLSVDLILIERRCAPHRLALAILRIAFRSLRDVDPVGSAAGRPRLAVSRCHDACFAPLRLRSAAAYASIASSSTAAALLWMNSKRCRDCGPSAARPGP